MAGVTDELDRALARAFAEPVVQFSALLTGRYRRSAAACGPRPLRTACECFRNLEARFRRRKSSAGRGPKSKAPAPRSAGP